MSAKQLLPNQCNILHPVTGVENCCLCAERAETMRLRAEVARLRGALAIIAESESAELARCDAKMALAGKEDKCTSTTRTGL